MIEPLMLAALLADDYAKILGQNLVGVYAHGSLAFGCFYAESSDLDLLVVVRQEPSQSEKEALLRVIFQRESISPEQGVELTVVPYKSCQEYRHPAPYYLQYDRMNRMEARRDLSAYCRRMTGRDKKLAQYFTVARFFGLCIYGTPTKQVFLGVPEAHFIDSLEQSLQRAQNEIRIRCDLTVLELCRILAYAEAGYVVSKTQAGRWALNEFTGRWKGLVYEALTCYCTGREMDVPDDVEDFGHYMKLRTDNALHYKKQQFTEPADSGFTYDE